MEINLEHVKPLIIDNGSIQTFKNADWNNIWQITDSKKTYSDYLMPHAQCIDLQYNLLGDVCDADGEPLMEKLTSYGMAKFMFSFIQDWIMPIVDEIDK